MEKVSEPKILLNKLGQYKKANGKQISQITELANKCGVKFHRPSDFFNALVAARFLDRDQNDLYSLSEISQKVLNPNNYEHYMVPYFIWTTSRAFTLGIDRFKQLLQSEEIEEKVQLGSEYYTDVPPPDFFSDAMHGVSMLASVSIPQLEFWKDFKTFADIGGSKGTVSVQICKAHEHIFGTVCELPSVQEKCEQYIKAQNLSDRLQFQELDFFRQEFPEVDVLIFGHILHNWPIETSQMILQKARKALNKNGAIIVYQAFLDNEKKNNFKSAMMELNMALMGKGQEFTEQEILDLITKNGFSDARIHNDKSFKAAIAFKRETD
ncbi:methyltransferase [Stylonychia lemnae]|uniref:Methyltransferase n=1 Tax=Stylonychia lemnae TaxID=5949 RepID=A0A078A1A6_STYLE|nr:methyltransferase [Stylonychia lemnae]|eukprot:CDW74564.1 methyltransferase [Stylonychia lemnae]